MNRLRNRGPAGLFGLAALLLIATLVVAACAFPAPSTPAATAPPAQATTAQQPTSAPTISAPANTPASQPSGTTNLPVGVDADGNFYKGDLNAPVKLIEYSDFQ